MRPPITANCPVCGKSFYNQGKSAREKCVRNSIRHHLENIHHLPTAEAQGKVDALNIGPRGCPSEQFEREWAEFVSKGVLR